MMKAIFFDMDGTLFQTTSILETALDVTFDALRADGSWQGATPIDTYFNIMGVPLPVVWQKLCPDFTEPQRIAANENFHQQLILAIQQQHGELYEGAKELLQQLAKHYPLFVTSNGEVEYLKAIVQAFDIEQYFTQVYSIQQIDSLNKSELVALAKQQHGVTEGFVVGDRLSDIQAAKDNGLIAIGVNFDFAQQQELQQADYVVQQLGEIPRIVDL